MRVHHILVPLVAALAAAASPLTARHLHPLARQLTSDAVTAACQSRCLSTTSIYEACMAGKESQCLSVCEQPQFDELVDCVQCSVDDLEASRSEVASLSGAVAELRAACREVGKSVTGTVGNPSAQTSGITIAASRATLDAYLTGSSSAAEATGVTIESADTVRHGSAGFARAVCRLDVGVAAAILGWAGVALLA